MTPQERADAEALADYDKARLFMRNVFGTYEDLSVERVEGSNFLSVLVNMGSGKVYRVQFEAVPLVSAPDWSN